MTWEKLPLADSSPQSVVETSDLYSELEELLRETLVPGIPPAQSPTPGYHLTPAVAMITEEAFYEPTEDMEDVVASYKP